MKSRSRVVSYLLASVCVAGCASTTVTDRQVLVTEKVPRPNRILVYNFAATPADAPELANQAAAGGTPQTAEQIRAGRELGAQIASHLAANIRAMGLPADAVPIGTPPQMNDIVTKGYLLSVHEGSAAERMAIGLGAGAAQFTTAVEGFQMTPQGLRKLGSGTVEAVGSKAPGAALGVAGLIATGNPHSQQWNESLRRGERQQQARGQSRSDRQGNSRKDQAAIPTAGLDPVSRGARPIL